MDSYEDKNPQGTLYLLHTQEEIAFTNLFELLEQLYSDIWMNITIYVHLRVQKKPPKIYNF